MRSRKVHLRGTHTRKNRCYTVIYMNFSWDLIHFLVGAFFETLGFFVAALLLFFFAAGAALLFAVFDDVVEGAAAVDVAEALPAVFPLDGFDFDVLLLAFDVPPAAFFFDDVAFFFGLLALLAGFALADPFDFGLAVLAFLAPVDAFFLLAPAAGVVAGAVAVAGATVVVVDGLLVAAVVLVVAAFFAGFLVGEAERFRLLVPLDDFGLLDDGAFFVLVPPVFLLPPGVFDRLRDFVADDVLVVDFLVVDFFFVPADEPFFDGDAANLKLPLAPTPFVCFNVLFFVPARNADLRC
jgi:hypothetical protein